MEIIDADIQQLLMEDLRRQLEYLVRIRYYHLPLSIFINHKQVFGPQYGPGYESQAAIKADQGHLYAVLEIRKRKLLTTLHKTAAQ